MEHIDALEAVRRLTLERDALAEQVKELERTRAEWEQQENALQAPVRRERPETGTEPTKDQNGAPRGCNVPLCACCKRPVLRAVFCDACESRAADRVEKEPQRWDGLSFGGVAIQLKEQYNGTQTCEVCKHGRHSLCDKMVCTRHAPKHGERIGERGFWPLVSREDTCGDWEGK